jgi:hypothetical protein
LLYRLPKLELDPKVLQALASDGPDAKGTVASAEVKVVVHVVGGGLVTRRRTEALTCILPPRTDGCEIIPLIEQDGDKVVEQLSNADVVHFDCHGHANPPLLRTGATSVPELQLTLPLVEGSLCKVRTGCLVFSNACESDAPELSFGKDRSFGRAFYTKGAGAFLGTLGKVPEGLAFEFADAFYRSLTGAAGGDVGEAFRVARDAMSQHSVIVYALYGNPLKMPFFPLRVSPGLLSC